MENPSVYLEALVREFGKLPGIGRKSASRLAFHVLKMKDEQVRGLAAALLNLKEHIVTCNVCGGISDKETCAICADTGRDRHLLCVVENAKDVLTIEAAEGFRGYYHVLNGLISPLDGIGPEDLNIESLEKRCADGQIKEVILALNPTIEGDATAVYLAEQLRTIAPVVSRIARGLPVGADIEFADSATIAKSIEGRVRL